jgi:hypothetical protein
MSKPAISSPLVRFQKTDSTGTNVDSPDLQREKRRWEAETFKSQETMFYDAIEENLLINGVSFNSDFI